MDLRIPLYLILSLLAFAANSVLCRLALGHGYIDPISFTSIRLISGAIALGAVLWFANRKTNSSGASRGSWLGAICLFVYAIAFSFAYITLETGTGALILFGTVQISMLSWAFFKGQKLGTFEVLGVLLAFGGISYLMLPSISTPSLYGFLLMMLSGVAWGTYSLLGQGSQSPLSDTAFNFIRTLPVALILFVGFYSSSQLTLNGIVFAVISGVLASGVGYAIWYKVLPLLANSVAAVSQLSVPIIAAVGGLIWVSEPLTLRLMLSSILVLGGIFLVIKMKRS